MLLGIDVGGTFTDAVIVEGGQVVAQAKRPTTHGELLAGILAAMDAALAGLTADSIERVALSTTIVTNALVENKTDQVGLIIIPGPGLDITGMVPEEPVVLSGYIDHRGREVAAPTQAEVTAACRRFAGRRVFAVSGKFAVRNPAHELTVAQWVEQAARPEHITLASQVCGSLNFWRRTNSAYYNAAVWRRFAAFADAVEQALAERGITAPVYILKADGGTLPLPAARRQPVEAVFTGPAASVLGIMALTDVADEAVSLDIGGTTTDIALWQSGAPLFAARGASINGYPTAVRAFWLKSVGVGGDSFVRREGDSIAVGPERRGPAMAAGGPVPTVADAMIVAGIASFGDREQALAAMRQLDPARHAEETARTVLDAAAATICRAIAAMLAEHHNRPVYKVDDIVHSLQFTPRRIVAVGGAAALATVVATKLGLPVHVPDRAVVANAIGAAVARPTLTVTVRADTAQGYYTVAEQSLRAPLARRQLRLADMRDLAGRHLAERAAQLGIPVGEAETVYEEEFNLVRGFSTTGKILTCQQQIRPGVVTAWREGRGSDAR
ncbi:hydantoinase/oxoprolinase family protein [Sporolituus thermophilus]|uniref:N-methylhydantoinase A/oxoprolinase/acetone carboxylase, beta subunit n=1 Tax=Sporolituus thermophilus DSM 23256 TaxID=1123285 RepID=A0A1G7K5L4_9FIRM|nr:hydantoinase/oxoprolinase family protein [Sporolituus thermophilus]SDF32380.1 N-methylhydantoinase A/oxoprolinase/acetone carboxylase, beta subunit [Sporolituus thermophilus DSM 23256]